MKLKSTRGLFLLFALFFVTPAFAKTAFQEAPPPPEGYALIYMYRIKAAAGLRKPTILIDREEVSKIPNNAYTWFYVSAGTHSLQTKWGAFSDVPDLEVVLNLAPGETYFLRLESEMRSMGKAGTRVYTAIKEADANTGHQELQKTKKYFAATQQMTGAASTVAEETAPAETEEEETASTSPSTQVPPPPAGYGLVYIYRPNSHPKFHAPKIFVDGQEVLKLSNKAHSWFYVAEGSHNIQVYWGKYEGESNFQTTFRVFDQQTHFLRVTITRLTKGNYDVYPSRINSVDTALGNKELKFLPKYVKPKLEKID